MEITVGLSSAFQRGFWWTVGMINRLKISFASIYLTDVSLGLFLRRKSEAIRMQRAGQGSQ
jgi:hypothetical protein